MSEGTAPGTVPPTTPAAPTAPRAGNPDTVGPADPATTGGRRRWIPLWVLQLAELVVAFVLVDISVHVANSGLMVAAAVAFAALAVTAHGPLGIFRICPPWLHLTLVISVAAVVAVAPVVPALRPDIEGIIVIEFGAVGLIRLATLTDMHASSRSRRPLASRRHDPSVIDATATVTSEAGVPSTTADTSATAASPSGTAARRAGRAAGTASASGKRAVAKHRPEAEKQVKRAIREAGRLAARMTSHSGPGPSGTSPGEPSDG
jgi:hypothetical protein